jgi:hypothetical protein
MSAILNRLQGNLLVTLQAAGWLKALLLQVVMYKFLIRRLLPSGMLRRAV